MEWIYFVIIFFYILNAISKATKKKKEEELKQQAVKATNRRVEARPAPREEVRTGIETAAEAFTDLPLSEIMQMVSERVATRGLETTAQAETEDYDLTSQFDTQRPEDQIVIDREHSAVSHFHTAEGMRKSLSDRSSMATAPQFTSATFSFASKSRSTGPLISLNKANLKDYFVASEILGKPKALRKR